MSLQAVLMPFPKFTSPMYTLRIDGASPNGLNNIMVAIPKSLVKTTSSLPDSPVVIVEKVKEAWACFFPFQHAKGHGEHKGDSRHCLHVYCRLNGLVAMGAKKAYFMLLALTGSIFLFIVFGHVHGRIVREDQEAHDRDVSRHKRRPFGATFTCEGTCFEQDRQINGTCRPKCLKGERKLSAYCRPACIEKMCPRCRCCG